MVSLITVEQPTELRKRIVRAAAGLLTHGGPMAVSTRAVSAEAGIQAPAIYRHFADMHDLLQAAAREVLAAYIRRKTQRVPSDDPLEELRRGWDFHVAFGLANPAAYTLIFNSSAARGEGSEAQDGQAMLRAAVARVAEAGQLRVKVLRAAQLIHAGVSGVTLLLISSPLEERDLHLSDAMRDALFDVITVRPTSEPERGPPRVAARAIALGAILAEAEGVLSPGEQQLIGEWLDRLASMDGSRTLRLKKR